MPTLREFIAFFDRLADERGESFSDEFTTILEREMRRKWPGEKIYVLPPNSRKDPARGEAIVAAAKKLPTGIVRERFGISRQLVSYHVKKSKDPAR